MSDIVVYQPEELKMAEDKGKGWYKFGYDLALCEIDLSNKILFLDPTLPKVINDLPAAEEELKSLKISFKEIQDRRKYYTGNFEKVSTRVMQPEKQVETFIATLSDAILKLKMKHEDEKKKTEARTRELQTFRQNTQLQYNQFIATCEKTVIDMIDSAYRNALENISVQYYKAHVGMLKNQCTVDKFPMGEPTNTDPDKLVIIKEVTSNFSAQTFIDKYYKLIDEKFSDFPTAKSQKDAALQIHTQQTTAAETDIEFNLEMDDVVAGLDANIQTVSTPSLYVKPLRKIWEVDMVVANNQSNISHIMKAFMFNFVNCMAKCTRKDYGKIDIYSMMDMLAACKADDENFQPDKIIFNSKQSL